MNELNANKEIPDELNQTEKGCQKSKSSLKTLPKGMVPLPGTIRALMSWYDIREADIARGAEVKQATLNTILSGSSKDPRITTVVRLALFLNVSVDQLVGLQPINYQALQTKSINKRILIPVISWGKISEWLTDQLASEQDWKWIPTDECNNKKAFALKTQPFMYSHFGKDAILIINPAVKNELRDGCFVVYYDTENAESVNVKQVVRDGGNYFLKALDPNIPYQKVPSDFKSIGIIVEVRLVLEWEAPQLEE